MVNITDELSRFLPYLVLYSCVAWAAAMEPALSLPSSADTAVVQAACAGGHSADTLFGGELFCHQPLRGYRFSVDAVLLAHFVRPRHDGRILDLGCGCGVVALILAYRCPTCTLVGIEYQAELALLARANVDRNGFQERMQILAANVRQVSAILAPESFDLVVCNPPYFSEGRGRISQDIQVAQARHGLLASLDDFICAAAFAVKNRSRVVFIFPASGQAQLQQLLLARRLMPKRIQMIYSSPTIENARLVLVEAMKNGGADCQVLPPFYLYTQPGVYSEAMQRLYQEGRCWPKC